MRFTRENFSDQSLGELTKKVFTREGVKLVKVAGSGRVYCADAGKKVWLVNLTNESLYLNGKDLLAMSMSLQHSIKLMKGSEMLAGGLANVKVRTLWQCNAF